MEEDLTDRTKYNKDWIYEIGKRYLLVPNLATNLAQTEPTMCNLSVKKMPLTARSAKLLFTNLPKYQHTLIYNTYAYYTLH